MCFSYFEGKVESFIMDLLIVLNEKEVVVQKLYDVILKCNQLEQVIEEDVLNVVVLKFKIESLEEIVVVMKVEVLLYINLQYYVSRVIGMLEFFGQVSFLNVVKSYESNSLNLYLYFFNMVCFVLRICF